ncbi:hypothetical protein [uncultured Sphingorhabdus sp.]|uniref:hypothetical protein n=1 Tax=uncultured Sphingorhabdus sp. TaxID=1686106 RepID=UPI002634E901|nr:hypothetical protein [uncultured Sphingorhabdus sp.]HMS20023.1 hypothetical protein [Sphingorhabdus sp.]
MNHSTTANYKQFAAAELCKALGHLDACLHLWSPGTGLSPNEEKTNDEVLAWKRLNDLADQLRSFAEDEGPGA